MYDWLIVGAGFAGSVLAERLAAERNERVLLIDRRPHIGGNAYDRYDDDGKLAETWGQWDTLTFMRDVGAIPAAAVSSGS